MEANTFEGHSSQMRDSPWLASEDILEREPVEVVVEQIYYNKGVEFDNGRKENKYSIKFKGAEKQLILNNTNRKALVQAYGPDVKKWIGKKVSLVVDKNVKLRGQIVNGVRIRT